MSDKPKPPGYRFSEKVYRGDSKLKNLFEKTKGEIIYSHVCGICKEKYDGYVKIKSTTKGLVCSHERPSRCEDPHLTAGEQKRISSRLQGNEAAVKGNDGVIRIIEK